MTMSIKVDPRLEKLTRIEQRDVDFCDNCGKRTIYYDKYNGKYICSFECGQDITTIMTDRYIIFNKEKNKNTLKYSYFFVLIT